MSDEELLERAERDMVSNPMDSIAASLLVIARSKVSKPTPADYPPIPDLSEER